MSTLFKTPRTPDPVVIDTGTSADTAAATTATETAAAAVAKAEAEKARKRKGLSSTILEDLSGDTGNVLRKTLGGA